MKTPLSALVRDRHGVFALRDKDQEFTYSDGTDREKYILETLSVVRDLSTFSEELRGKICDWPSEYHFSPERHNLLRHIDLNPGMTILELGCGCGAITRQLGESGATVTAVEGSPRRAQAAAVRCRDLANVSVYCSNFQDVEFVQQYDVVTLIGVLEYSRQYFKSSDPVRECLEIARNALQPGGVLLLAIENQLGLKYFCGLREDHADISFFGIEDRYTANTAVTFGRKELEGIIRDAGFRDIIFHYPFPDYKIPKATLTERAFLQNGFSPEEILRQIGSRDYCGDLTPTFEERLAVPTLCRNGIMQDHSNSFLVLASPCPGGANVLFDSRLLAAYYATERAMPYNVKTRFLATDEGVIANKERLLSGAPLSSTNDILSHQPQDETYVVGKNLEAQYRKHILMKDFDCVFRLLDLQIEFLKSQAVGRSQHGDTASPIIKEDYFDCTPANLIVCDGRLSYVDREWILNKPVSLGALALRTVDALHVLGPDMPELSKDALMGRFALSGIRITPVILEEYASLIHNVVSQVYQGMKYGPTLGTVGEAGVVE